MTDKANIDPRDRGFYFSANGDNVHDGRSLELPRQTIQSCIDSAEALVPPPSTPNPGFVNEAQGGVFTESIILCNSILFDATQTSIVSSDPITAIGASFISFNCQTLVNSAANGIGLKIDAESNFGSDMDLCQVTGTNGVAFDVSGACDSLFFTCSLISISGDGGKGFNVTASSTDPVDININKGLMNGNNETMVEWNMPTPSDEGAIDISIISSNGTNNTAFHMVSGGLNIIAQHLKCDQILLSESGTLFTMTSNVLVGDTLLKSGSTASISCAVYIGDIEIESSALFTVNIGRHNGTVTNNGDTNGIINGTRYGTSILPDLEDQNTSETDKSKVLRPDGVGSLEWKDRDAPAGYANWNGLLYLNATKVTVTAGSWRDDDDSLNLVLTSNTTVDNTVIGPGGRQTGSAIGANDWVGIYVIGDTTGVNATNVLAIVDGALFSEPGYDVIRRVGWTKNLSGSLIPFFTTGKARDIYYQWDDNGNDLLLLNAGNATTFTTVDCSAGSPPGGGLGKFTWCIASSGTGQSLSVRTVGEVGVSDSQKLSSGDNTMGNNQYSQGELLTDSDQLIEYLVSTAALDASIFINGFVDNI